METSEHAKHTPKTRTQFHSILARLSKQGADQEEWAVLVLGGTKDDVDTLQKLGFKNISLTNLASAMDRAPAKNTNGIRQLAVDAEDMGLPDNSYDLVFAHEVLHHCRSPHRAVCEMLRVSRRHVIFLEPNDSAFMRVLVRMGFSFPYEITAVVAHGCTSAGLRDSAIPNYVYRWNENEVFKTVSSFMAEHKFTVRAYPYWDFNVDERGLKRRKHTKLHLLTSTIGARNFLALLRLSQGVLNRLPLMRKQGNKFFCQVEKDSQLKPWLVFDRSEIVFNRDYS